MRQAVDGQTYQMASGRSIRLLSQSTEPGGASVGSIPDEASVFEHLPVRTADQLHTLLVLCRNLAVASAAELSVQTESGWLTLVRSTPVGTSQEPSFGNKRAAMTSRVNGKHYVVRLASTPVLVMALIVHQAVSAETAQLLKKTLELTLPILRAGDRTERDEQTRRRVLNMQAELAHELRTPLTAISGFAQLLQRPGQLDEERRRSYAGIAVTETQQATAIIDHLVARLQVEVEALGSEEELAGPDSEAAGQSPS